MKGFPLAALAVALCASAPPASSAGVCGEKETFACFVAGRRDLRQCRQLPRSNLAATKSDTEGGEAGTRRAFLARSTTAVTSAFLWGTNVNENNVAQAIGPVRVDLQNPTYSAAPCPPNRPIPGEKAMKGMRGLCVTVKAELASSPPKDLEKVGVYGFVKDPDTGDSVLANNPDLNTDAGQFSMIPSVSTKDTKVEFEFIAAVPMEKDLSSYSNGIGELDFGSLRIVSFPGGQQYGAISPCEMDEFSMECEEWEEENGPYERGQFMVKSNPRTKGR